MPPVCVADENPCCEREAWENIPIVSSMCKKCADFCAGIAPQQVKRLSGEAALRAGSVSDKKVAEEIKNIFRGGGGDCDGMDSDASQSSLAFHTKLQHI